ncbi:helix-turn-helix transcriptional regulator [Acrocarpospora catenulata]|uniref:helix-turn-helix transcriptional regulator n=1 Tax=Acrocarpospora catenulata TaxID=2836182 RepID=UPI001BD91725|nr:LuxR family transcriptional regulator [Acrocarpospora catenulata]
MARNHLFSNVNIEAEVFAGRGTELAALAAELDRVRDGHPGIVLIEGPAGIGKTALTRRALAQAKEFTVLWASGDEMEITLPYGMIAQLTDGLSPGTSSGGLGLGGFGPEGGPRGFGPGGGPGGFGPGGGQADGFVPGGEPIAVGAALVALLGELAEAAPLAIVLDDVQWADGESLQALTYALRRMRAGRVLTVAITRRLSATRVPAGMARLLSRGPSLRLALAGLTLPELRLMTGLGPTAAARLHHHAGGNPLYVAETLRQAPRLDDPAADLPAPPAYARGVRAKLATCGPPAHALARAAAVLGESCSVRHAVTLADSVRHAETGADPTARETTPESAEALAVLKEVVATGVLRYARNTGELRVEFPHPLVRAAVYQDIGPAERTAAHRIAADLVGDEADRLRHRLRAASRPDPEVAAEIAAFARRQAAAGHWESAAAHFADAGELAAGTRERSPLTAATVDALLRAGRLARAAEVATRGPLDAVTRPYVLGAIAHANGDTGRAFTLMKDAWTRCDPRRDGELAARIAGQLALLSLVQGDHGVLDQKVWLLEVDPDSWQRLLLPFLEGRAEDALKVAAALPDPALASAGQLGSLVVRGALRIWCDELEAGRGDLAGVVADAHGQDTRLAAMVLLALAEFRLGAWDTALALGKEVIAAESEREQYWLTPYARAVLVLPLAARGEFARARSQLELARRRELSVLAEMCLAYAEGWLCAVRGDFEDVVRVLEPLRRKAGREMLPWRDLLADAYSALGRFAAAEAVLGRFSEAEAGGTGDFLAAVRGARARATLDAARGRPAGAVGFFERALAGLGPAPVPLEQARVEMAYGVFLRRLGRRAAAAAHLTTAGGLLRRLAARPLLDRCEQELAACGPGQGHPDGLTSQERRVTRLALTGLSNKQIARRLDLSVKTIEYHLGHVYAKLGVSSRAALVAKLAGPGGMTA